MPRPAAKLIQRRQRLAERAAHRAQRALTFGFGLRTPPRAR